MKQVVNCLLEKSGAGPRDTDDEVAVRIVSSRNMFCPLFAIILTLMVLLPHRRTILSRQSHLVTVTRPAMAKPHLLLRRFRLWKCANASLMASHGFIWGAIRYPRLMFVVLYEELYRQLFKDDSDVMTMTPTTTVRRLLRKRPSQGLANQA